jgi:hypothetical protein
VLQIGERVSRERSGMAVGAECAACGARRAERDTPGARQLRSAVACVWSATGADRGMREARTRASRAGPLNTRRT